MEQKAALNVGNLKLTIRRCNELDKGFIYELMEKNLGNYFKEISESWSRKIFKERFDKNRIKIIEHGEMPIGFFDYEIKNGELYLHNITLSEDYKRLGIGSYILSLLCEEGKVRGISTLKGKIFYKNKKALAWAKKHNIKILGRLPSEKSYITKKFILEK